MAEAFHINRNSKPGKLWNKHGCIGKSLRHHLPVQTALWLSLILSTNLATPYAQEPDQSSSTSSSTRTTARSKDEIQEQKTDQKVSSQASQETVQPASGQAPATSDTAEKQKEERLDEKELSEDPSLREFKSLIELELNALPPARPSPAGSGPHSPRSAEQQLRKAPTGKPQQLQRPVAAQSATATPTATVSPSVLNFTEGLTKPVSRRP